MNITRLPVVLAMAAALLGGSLSSSTGVAAEAKPDDSGYAECVDDCGKEKKGGEEEAAPAGPAVVIDGGTVTNVTTLDITADGGTSISDASGGDNNVAIAGGGAEFDAEGNAIGDVASVGNGGIAESSANGGAVSVGSVNSGGNAGNAIVVGDTNAGGGEEHKPVEPKPVCCEKPTYDGKKDTGGKTVTVNTGGGTKGGGNVGNAGGGRGGDRVRGLPATGAGLVAGESGSTAALLVLAVGALGAAGYSLRRRVA